MFFGVVSSVGPHHHHQGEERCKEQRKTRNREKQHWLMMSSWYEHLCRWKYFHKYFLKKNSFCMGSPDPYKRNVYHTEKQMCSKNLAWNSNWHWWVSISHGSYWCYFVRLLVGKIFMRCMGDPNPIPFREIPKCGSNSHTELCPALSPVESVSFQKKWRGHILSQHF